MLALLQLLLPEVAAHHRVAVLVDAIDEVLAGHADHAALPVLQLAFIDVAPVLHNLPQQYSCTSTVGWWVGVTANTFCRSPAPKGSIPESARVELKQKENVRAGLL